MTDDIEILKVKLTGLKNKVPVLILGKAQEVFRRTYNGKIYTFRDNIEEELSKATNHLHVIDIAGGLDIVRLSNLIKNYNIILLSYRENKDVLPLVNYIIKFKNDTNNNLYTTEEAMNKLKALEEVDMETFYADDSAKLKYDIKIAKQSSLYTKILPLVGVIE